MDMRHRDKEVVYLKIHAQIQLWQKKESMIEREKSALNYIKICSEAC
jgi:hypothetical protein